MFLILRGTEWNRPVIQFFDDFCNVEVFVNEFENVLLVLFNCIWQNTTQPGYDKYILRYDFCSKGSVFDQM